MVSGSRFPLIRSLDMLEPLALLRTLAVRQDAFVLHTSLVDERSRWTFFGAEPFAVFGGDEYPRAVDSFRALAARVREDDPQPGLVPFTGGAVGYWAYDFGRRFERLPERAADDLSLPDVRLAFYDVIGAFDHRSRQAWLFSSGLPVAGDERSTRAERRLDHFERLFNARPAAPPFAMIETLGPVLSTFDRDAYLHAIEAVQEHIRRGDIYQANLSQRWSLKLGDTARTAFATALFEGLAERSAAPFSAYLGAGDHSIVSASPERFLELRRGRVEARPIKGTRPRGADPAHDTLLRDELMASDKDRAENVMIVDVLRNDLGRVCEAGTVRTSALCEIETFPQVFHLTSTIGGELRSGLDAFDLLHACFPGGSITGAPKIRAMEILETLEPVRRHIYTGSVGYLDWRGDADWNIAIRTALVAGRTVHFAAGGGITADSEPEAEYRETLHKAEGMRLALERVGGPVTLEPGEVPA